MVDNQPMWKYAINHFANFTKFMTKLICIAEFFYFFRLRIILVVQIYTHIFINGMHF